MKNNIKLSVAMATYNGAKYIQEQLDSIINQTLTPDEIVISDDGSTDGTLALVLEYISSHSNIILVHNTNNHGAEGNFSNEFNYCTGDIIFPSDQDDIWAPNKIEKMLEVFSNDVEIVYAQDIIFDENGTIGETSWKIPMLYKAMWKNTLAGHACAFRKSILSNYRPTRKLSWDYEICLYGSVNINKVVGIPDVLVHWRRHAKALTTHKSNVDSEIPRNKYKKLWYALRNCASEYSIPFYEYMQARKSFIESVGGG